MMFQMLESFQIIDSTIKLDVFIQRLDFLGKLANNLPKNADKETCIRITLHAYANKYPLIEISQTIRLILDEPQIALSAKFKDEATTAFFLRTCNMLKNEMRGLKTVVAKERRFIQASQLADVITERLSSCEKQRYITCIYDELTLMSEMVSYHPS